MAKEPELKTTMKQRALNPLLMAWGFIVILLGLTISWVMFSEDPAIVQEIAINDQAEVALNSPQQSITAVPETSQIVETPEPPQIAVETSTLIDTQTALRPVPNENLIMRGDNGFKPVMGPDGLIAWKEYARPYTGSEDAPRIAILVTDIGLNTKASEAAINDLPGTIDLAFSPYGRNLQLWMDNARKKGHEGFLMIPTEPLNYPDNDPGPHTLIADFSARDNLLRLDWLLSQVTGYVGVINHMGSRFTASEEALTPILEDLHSRGLMFLDSRSTRFSMAARLARRIGMPRAMNDRYIDNITSTEEIQKQLNELENTAKTFGAAVGLTRALPLTINEIAAWANTLKDKGIELVPVTALANRQPIK